jgi:hypothetical protein
MIKYICLNLIEFEYYNNYYLSNEMKPYSIWYVINEHDRNGYF